MSADRVRTVTEDDQSRRELSRMDVGILWHRHDVDTDGSFILLTSVATAILLA
jgi:hypothetical protein